MKAAAGIRIYSRKKISVNAKDLMGVSHSYSYSKGIPGELFLSGKIKAADLIDLGVYFSILGKEQASPYFDEFSGLFITDFNNNSEPASSNDNRDENQIHLAVGGMYHANESSDFYGALHYLEHGFKKSEYAAVEAENIGGTQIHIGTKFSIQTLSPFFQASYQIPETISYIQPKTNAPAVYKEGESVELEQETWNFGGGFVANF